MGKPHSYHDLEIETSEIQKTSISNLPYGLEVTCSRTSGWELWDNNGPASLVIAGEYDTNWLRLTVGDTVIVGTKRTTINKAIRTLKRLTRELEKELSDE